MDEHYKIENKNYEIIKSQFMMKPKYSVEQEYNYCSIDYTNREYILDAKQFNMIINFDKNFKFYNKEDDYPAYSINNKRINYLEFLYGLNPDNYIYIFKNNNKYDLRNKNVTITDKDFQMLVEDYNVIEFMNNAILITMGKYSGQYKNPMCKILNKNDELEILMLCNQNILCKLCPKSYEKILEYEKNKNNEKKIVWSYQTNGYILGNNNLYIHQIIMDFYGNGKGTKNESIDHIDQNPLNNCLKNLRIATRLEQEQNSKGIKEGTKRERKQSAKDLPEGITQQMMRKYVVYYEECYNKEKDLHREFFKVERHPGLDKPWASSKSGKVALLEKLAQANKIVDDLEANIQPEPKKTLPLHISIINFREKPHLVFDKRCDDGKRQNVKMVLPSDYNLEAELERLNDKIKAKYEIEI